MSLRELTVLGTASQVPTRQRNHTGHLLRWDGHGLLFDPGEGTQRQLTLAGVAATTVTHVLVTHFHGDHCLGLPGIIQRLSLDEVAHPVEIHFPAEGTDYFTRLRHAAAFHEKIEIRPRPVKGPGTIIDTRAFRVEARRLSHPVPTYGYRLVEPDGRRMLPDRLAVHGVGGPAAGELRRAGVVEVAGRRVTLEEVSVPRPGQRFAHVMDTRWCEAAVALAEGVDLLVCEATFLDEDAGLADFYGHLTVGQAARLAADAGARRLVLTHFSRRYSGDADFPARVSDVARAVFDGEVVVAADLDRVPVPPRRRTAPL